jgi:DNA end-binding protein Ku
LPEDEDEQTPSARPFWSGTITFGLVSIPVSLFPANRSGGVSLRMLGPDGTPLSRRYYSEKTGRDLSADELVRGYEIEKDRYVLMSDEELDRLAPEKSRDIDLRRFVPAESVPPRYFDRGYFLSPAGGSTKAYKLLAQTMEETGRAGIATFVMRGKEYLVAILSDNGILRAETLRFHDEIRSPEAVGLPEKPKLPAKLIRDFEKIIDSEAADDIDRKHLKDEDAERLLKVVNEKRKKSKDVVTVEQEKDDEDSSNVVDLLEVLKRSLAGSSAKKPAKSESRKTAPRKTASRRK